MRKIFHSISDLLLICIQMSEEGRKEKPIDVNDNDQEGERERISIDRRIVVNNNNSNDDQKCTRRGKIALVLLIVSDRRLSSREE